MNETCPKCNTGLKRYITKQNVVVDLCMSCKGTWMDKGEIHAFVKSKIKRAELKIKNLKTLKKSDLNCPRCRRKLYTGNTKFTKVEIDICNTCHGLWLDRGELKQILDTEINEATPPKMIPKGTPRKIVKRVLSGGLPKLPSLKMASLISMGGLYLILFAVMVLLAELDKLDVTIGAAIMVGLIFLQFLLAPFFMDLSLKWLGSLSWVSYEKLPPNLNHFIITLCEQKGLPTPKFGIIEDSAPNAFTYGRTPWSARLVISRGLFEILSEKEVEAVIAHEMGHVAHWDFLYMTIAQLVPIILYHIYRACYGMTHGKNSKNSKAAGPIIIAAVVAYIAYKVSLYIVLYLSRVREYWADRFSGEVTKNPNAIATALVKISYGISNAEPKKGDKGSRENKRKAVQAMGISDIGSAKHFSLYAAQGQGTSDFVNKIKRAMQWDMWNPWATYYEVHSTHPLTAKRINALSLQALAMGQDPKIIFDLKKPESYLDEFLVDVFIMLLPFIGALGVLSFNYHELLIKHGFAQGLQSIASEMASIGPVAVLTPIIQGFCIGMILKLLYTYGGKFKPSKITYLLGKVKVSEIRSIPIRLKGTIIGKGIPGYIFSEDFVLKDDTGLIFLDYEQPLQIINKIFALLKSNKYIGQTVEVGGWYRRKPLPYVELQYIKTADGKVSYCYAYLMKFLFWSAVLFLSFGPVREFLWKLIKQYIG